MSLEESESELFQRAARGDEQAFSRLLVRQHEGLVAEVRGQIPANLAGVISPEDIAQEVYMVAFRRIGSLRLVEGARLHHWLAGVAANVLRDMVKAQRAAKRGGGWGRVEMGGNEAMDSLIVCLEALAVHSRTPSRSAAEHEADRAVQAAMDTLSEDHRQALHLRYMEALPVAEIAAKLNRTEGAVHQLCHRALRALYDAMGPSLRFLEPQGVRAEPIRPSE